MKQREAVYKSTVEALAKQGIEFVPGESIVHDYVTSELRKDITDRVVSLFSEGQVDLKDTPSNQAKLESPSELRKYVTGLITNWHNKDPQLNAGAKYEAKNPGSRKGAADSSIKEMKQLLKYLQDSGDELGAARVQAAIELRQSELEAAKSPSSPSIDINKIPDHLKELANF